MKKIVSLLAISLAASLIVMAQDSTHKAKPSATVFRDSSSRNKPAVPPTEPAQTETQEPAPAAQVPAPSPQVVPQNNVKEETADLPTGTAIRMKLETPLSTSSTKEGDGFSGRVTEDVVVNGRTIIPVGSSLTGRVLRSSNPRRIAGVPSMHLLPETVMLPNGTSFAINAAVVDTSSPHKLKVDDEGTIKGKGLSSGDKVEMAAGTGTGAVVGTIVGGGKGTLVGAAIGGSATVVHWLTKRHDANIPAGTELIMEISRPMNVSGNRVNTGD